MPRTAYILSLILTSAFGLGMTANAEGTSVAGAPPISSGILGNVSLQTPVPKQDDSSINNSTERKSTVLAKDPTSEVKEISASVLIDTSTTLAPGSAGASGSAGNDYSQSGLYRLDVGVPLPGSLTASLRGGYSEEYSYVNTDGSSGGFIDSRLGLSKGMGEISKNLSLATAFNLILPTSRGSQLAGLHSAMGLSLPLDYKTKKWDIGLVPGFTYYLYNFEVQDDGTPNIEKSVGLPLSVSYSFTDNLSLGVTLSLSRGWSYFGVPRDKFVSAYEVDYQIQKHIGVAIGLLTYASALKSNGLDFNYTLYDQNQTTGYVDATITL